MGGMGDNKEKDKEKDCSTCLYVSPIHTCNVPRAVSLICGVSCATYVLFPVTVPVTACNHQVENPPVSVPICTVWIGPGRPRADFRPRYHDSEPPCARVSAFDSSRGGAVN
jgi:hypothetical protein